MPLEPSVTYISDLNPAWPASGDPKSAGDDHIRNTKGAVLNSFPLVKGPVPIAHDQFASKDYCNQLAFNTVLPAQPGGAATYDLTTTNGSATWQLHRVIFDDSARLAQVAAISLALS